MSEEKKISDVKEVLTMLEEKVNSLRIEEVNLNARLQADSLRIEAQKKIDEIELTKKTNNANSSLDNREAKVLSMERVILLKEQEVKKRIGDLEGREREVVDFDERVKKFNQERKSFEEMRRSQIAELDVITEKKAHLTGKEDELKVREDNIRGREKAVTKQEKYYQDRVGELDAWARDIKTQVEHLEGLKKEIHYV